MLSVLTNECYVSQAWDPGSGEPEPSLKPFKAIWDTGATGSVITQAVVDACGLIPIGITKVSHVDGDYDTEVYLANIALPNRVAFTGIRVTKGKLKDADMLIGMNIISQGDFAVTNYNGITKFSFRIPSSRHIDFVAEINEIRARGTARPKQGRANLNIRRKKGKGKKRK